MKHIIYALQDPNTYEIRYVGLTSKGYSRFEEHLMRCNTKKVSKFPVYKWIKKLSLKNQKPNFIVVQEFLKKDYLFDAEVYWISYFKSQGSPLLNCTSGGDGVKNMIMTEELKQKISNGTKLWWKTLDKNIRNKIIKNNLSNHGQNKLKLIDQFGNEYNSITEASVKIKSSISAISLALKDNRPCKGFLFTKVGN